MSTCRDYENDELLAAFDRAEIWPYQFVPRAQTVTDECGGSDDEVGDVDGSGITRGARLERKGNRSSLDLPYTDYSRTSSRNKSLIYLKIVHSYLGIGTAAVYPQKKER